MRAMWLLTYWGLAEDEEQQQGSMSVVLKSTNDKIHIEEGANNPVRAFGVVFTKEMLLEQDFKE